MQARIDTGIAVINNTLNPAMAAAYDSAGKTGVNKMQAVISAASFIWIAGMAVMFLYSLISWISNTAISSAGMHPTVSWNGAPQRADSAPSRM